MADTESTGSHALWAIVVLVLVVVIVWLLMAGPLGGGGENATTDVEIDIQMPTVDAPAAPQ
jgi:hypothetical protein